MSRAPRHLPPLETLLDELGSTRNAARYLDVTERTVNRWRRAEYAPRAVMLALFWESRWGMSQTYTDAHNAAVQSAVMVGCLQREVERLRAQIERLERDHDWGSANSPIFNVG